MEKKKIMIPDKILEQLEIINQLTPLISIFLMIILTILLISIIVILHHISRNTKKQNKNQQTPYISTPQKQEKKIEPEIQTVTPISEIENIKKKVDEL